MAAMCVVDGTAAATLSMVYCRMRLCRQAAFRSSIEGFSITVGMLGEADPGTKRLPVA